MSIAGKPLFARFELRTISPHFGQTVVGIYDNLEEARQALELKQRSQDLPCIIYDAETESPVLPWGEYGNE